MEIKAEAKYVRISPRKVRLVVDAIKHLPLNRAIEELRLINKRAAFYIRKILVSARTNAVHNRQLDESGLAIKSIEVNSGPALKRWQPVSRGMAHGYKKRLSHIKVVLQGKEKKNGAKNKS